MQFNLKCHRTQNKKNFFNNKAWCNPYLNVKQLKEFIIKILIKTNENFNFLDLSQTNFTPTKKSSDFYPKTKI